MTEYSMTDEQIIAKWPDEIESFKTFCLNSNKPTEAEIEEIGEEPYDEIDFYDLSIGFFIAKGVPQVYAFALARITRYQFQYWC